MKYFKQIALLVVITLNILPAFTQQRGIQATIINQYMRDIDIKNDTSIQGSPYINEDFQPALVAFDDVEKVYNVRYNAYLDIIEVEDENKKKYSFSKSFDNLTVKVIKTGEVFELFKYLEGENTIKKSYFVHISPVENKVKLLKKNNVILIPARPMTDGYVKPKPASYKKSSDEFFIKVNDNLAILINRKKDVIKIFPEFKDEALKFIKDNKLKTSREEDLMELVNYMNTL